MKFKKIFYLLCLTLFLTSCFEKNIFLSQIKLDSDIQERLNLLKTNLSTIYSEDTDLNYNILGNLSLKNTIFLQKNELIIPISPEKTGQEITLDIGLFYNILNSTGKIYIEGFFLDFNKFKSIIDTAQSWITLTENINLGNYPLEKSLTNKGIDILFPTGEIKPFKVFMIFDIPNNKHVLIFKNGNFSIALDQQKILKIAPKLSMENLSKTINKNLPSIESEITKITNSYDLLNQTLNSK